MEAKDISKELWREYEFGRPGSRVVYRIGRPASLYVGTSTHRVVDATGTVHCVPNVGVDGCVLRWQNADPEQPVNF